MIVFRDPGEVPADFGPSVVAIGKFDGMHAGHRAVVDRARRTAATTATKVVAVTFDRNPLSVLRPDRCPPVLTGVHQKLQLLAAEGVDATLLLTFDEALAAIPAEQFVEQILVRALGAKAVLVGTDFRFGRGGAGDPALLQELGASLGFTVDVVDEVRAVEGERRVSSTWIRELLDEGDVVSAARLLGRPAAVWGEVVHGARRGRELGYPTANLSPDLEGFVPADGVYAGWLVDEGPLDRAAAEPRASIRYPAAISIGTNPTFDDVSVRQVEAYVLDEDDLDLYGHAVSIEFVDRIRGMVAFADIEALKDRMADDVERVRGLLS